MSFTRPQLRRGGGGSPLSKWHDIAMTEISSLVLCWRKVPFAHLPSPKYCILFFNCGILMQEGKQTMGGNSPLSKWHDITMTEISSLVLCWRKVPFAHLPSPKYCILFFNCGILMQEGEQSKSNCIKVPKIKNRMQYLISLSLWYYVILIKVNPPPQFTHLPASKYQKKKIGCSTLVKEGEQSEPSFNKVPNLISLSLAYHVILIKVNPPPWLCHGQVKLVLSISLPYTCLQDRLQHVDQRTHLVQSSIK